MSWEEKSKSNKYSQFKDAINMALAKICKYYNKFDNKHVSNLALCMFFLEYST